MSGDSWITLASVVGEVAVLGVMLRKGIWRKQPFFFSYILWALLSDIVALYFLVHAINEKAYLVFYHSMMSVDALLQFTVLVELAWSVLRPVRSQLPKSTPVALIVVVALTGLLIWPLASMAIPPEVTGEGRTVFRLAATFSVLRIVFFLIMAGFSQLLSIGWRDRELQIATGLGFYSIVSLMVMLFGSHQNSQDRFHWFSIAISISYLGTLFYWVLSFAGKEYERKEFSPQMQQFLVYMGGTARSGSIALTDLPPDRLRKRD